VIVLSTTNQIKTSELIVLCDGVSYPQDNNSSEVCFLTLKLFEEQAESFGPKEWKAFKIGNLITPFRISNAINSIATPKMFRQVLNPPTESQNAKHVILSRTSVAYHLSLGLNDAQRSALQEVMYLGGISIIQGPPGSRDWEN
jgi:hypothetical protein